MKLIIRQYLASLKERGELDVMLPDLLSQLGLTVYSRPARGTRQNGVDVGAVGSLQGEPDKVYLFTIKPGDLTRAAWDGTAQAVRASLDEIQDAYIPNRLPTEHRGKPVVICLCCGGDFQEQVREQWVGYTSKQTSDKLSFQEWNGDRLASLILDCFLREDLLPEHARSNLRKALAMLDEPDVACRHFFALIKMLAAVAQQHDARRTTAIRQMSICLWILSSWARDAGNTEAAYRAAEFTLLHAWEAMKLKAGEETKSASDLRAGFFSIFSAYQHICSDFHRTNTLPYVGQLHALSVATHGSCSLDINLKMFDLLGRLAMDGIWAYWGATRCKADESEQKAQMLEEAHMYAEATSAMIANNPTLLLPAKDDHAIDICIAASLLVMFEKTRSDIQPWFAEMVARATFSFEAHTKYPCALTAYGDLLEHPKSRDTEYKESVTSASILYPTIALWASLLKDESTYDALARMQQDQLQHCTYQFWYPDERSEENFYTNGDSHGATLANLDLRRPYSDFLTEVFGECDQTKYFDELSAVKYGYWPLVVIACRHYRLPLPLHLLNGLRDKSEQANQSKAAE